MIPMDIFRGTLKKDLNYDNNLHNYYEPLKNIFP